MRFCVNWIANNIYLFFYANFVQITTFLQITERGHLIGHGTFSVNILILYKKKITILMVE